jgi:DNA-binding IclR family transcriptional regulator
VSSFVPAATLPVHPTAVGRALLAFAPASVVEMTILRGLRAYTPHTVTAPDRFRRALAVVRLTRVAVTRFELEATACGVAVPVFGPGGDLVAAIELTVPDLGRELQPVMAALSIAARSLSRELGAGSSTNAAPVGGVYATVAEPAVQGVG